MPSRRSRDGLEMLAPAPVEVEQQGLPLGPAHGLLADAAGQLVEAPGIRLGQQPERCSPEQRLVPPAPDPPALLLDLLGVAAERAPDLEALPLDDALGPRDLAPDHRVVQSGIPPRRPAPPRDQSLDPVALQQVVLEADEEARRARIALSSGPAAKLVVDPPLS